MARQSCQAIHGAGVDLAAGHSLTLKPVGPNLRVINQSRCATSHPPFSALTQLVSKVQPCPAVSIGCVVKQVHCRCNPCLPLRGEMNPELAGKMLGALPPQTLRAPPDTKFNGISRAIHPYFVEQLCHLFLFLLNLSLNGCVTGLPCEA